MLDSSSLSYRIYAMYGYLDESGSPGATYRSNDFLAVSLVIIPDKETVDKCSASIDRLRKRLGKPDGYEFHYSRNSTTPKEAFVRLMRNLDFGFITIAICKNNSYRHASYDRLAQLFLHELVLHCKKIDIEMDANPNLHAKIKRHIKNFDLRGVKIRQVKSHSSNLIQLADYVVALSARYLKNPSRIVSHYGLIAKKQLGCVRIVA